MTFSHFYITNKTDIRIANRYSKEECRTKQLVNTSFLRQYLSTFSHYYATNLCYFCYSFNHSCCTSNKDVQQKMIILHRPKSRIIIS